MEKRVDLVSVLMCVYNTHIDYLREAVNSILTQTYENIEFVIVDDASSDEEVVKYLHEIDCNNPQIELLTNKSNMGLTKSLNVGLEHCHGKYIARMDSDDISMSDRLSVQVDYLESHPEVSLVGSDITCFGEGITAGNKPLDSDRCVDSDVYEIRSLFQHSGPPHPTFMFRFSFLKNNDIRYREDILKAQDYGIMADVLKAGGQIYRIRESLLKYRIHNGQISATSELEQRLYQSRVSFDFVKYSFPTLSDKECAAISLLGCSETIQNIISTLRENQKLRNVCDYILAMEDALSNPALYTRAIKKTITYNKLNTRFNPRKLEQELRFEWWKKAYRETRAREKLWGITAFTLLSYRYVMKIKLHQLRYPGNNNEYY